MMKSIATAGFLTLMLVLMAAKSVPSLAIVTPMGTPAMPTPAPTVTPGPIGSSAALPIVR